MRRLHPRRHWSRLVFSVPLSLAFLIGALGASAANAQTNPDQPAKKRKDAAPVGVQDPKPKAPLTGPAAAARRRMLRRLPKSFPGLQPKALLRFYENHNPDALAELDSECREDAAVAEGYLRRLTERFLVLDKLRTTDPDEFGRVLEIERLESKGLCLARKVREVRNAMGRDKKAKRALSADLQTAKDELRGILKRTFETAQQNQLIEINRLESEVRELRRLLNERATNEELIVERRFVELAGEEYAGEKRRVPTTLADR